MRYAAAHTLGRRLLLLQILEDLIKFRWKTLPPATKEGIRVYIVDKTTAVRFSALSLHCFIGGGRQRAPQMDASGAAARSTERAKARPCALALVRATMSMRL